MTLISFDWVADEPLMATSQTTAAYYGSDAALLQGATAQSVQDSATKLGKTGNDQLLVATVGWMFLSA